jgi:phage head maturation protease
MDRPHEDLIRIDTSGIGVRKADGDGMPTLYGQFANAGEWTEINSMIEGHYFERTSPGAFEKTISESVQNMRVLFHHGLDPRFGVQVLGPIRSLNPDTSYEVDLLDTPEIRSLVPGLEAGLYGSSYKFDIVKEDVNPRPTRSSWNPKGLPEVTMTELKVQEFGPTPIPSYKGTSAGIRSATDEFLLRSLVASEERLQVLLGGIRAAALEPTEPEASTPEDLSRSTQDEAETREEAKPSWHLS